MSTIPDTLLQVAIFALFVAPGIMYATVRVSAGWIPFTFSGDLTHYLSLEVMANVEVDRGAVANAANTLAAEHEWGIFGQNVVDTLTVIHAR